MTVKSFKKCKTRKQNLDSNESEAKLNQDHDGVKPVTTHDSRPLHLVHYMYDRGRETYGKRRKRNGQGCKVH